MLIITSLVSEVLVGGGDDEHDLPLKNKWVHFSDGEAFSSGFVFYSSVGFHTTRYKIPLQV